MLSLLEEFPDGLSEMELIMSIVPTSVYPLNSVLPDTVISTGSSRSAIVNR